MSRARRSLVGGLAQIRHRAVLHVATERVVRELVDALYEAIGEADVMLFVVDAIAGGNLAATAWLRNRGRENGVVAVEDLALL